MSKTSLLVIWALIFFKVSPEKYEYEIIFEKFTNQIDEKPNFKIPISINSWNLSFWIKINSFNVTNDTDFMTIFTDNTKIGISIKTSLQIFFGNNPIGNFLVDNSKSDIENLKSNSNYWNFISLNYDFQKFDLMFNDQFFSFPMKEEYLKNDGTKIQFEIDETNIIFSAHVHFFKFSIPISDIPEIRFYPQEILAIYKFSNYNSNTAFIINSINFYTYREVLITNKNRVPFNDYNSFVDVKIDLPYFNKSIVFKNLIICINSSIVFRNFIKDDNTLQNVFWTIYWYSRITEDESNSINFKSRISYSVISSSLHSVKFEHSIKENDLESADYSNNHNLDIGNSERDDFTLDLITIIQIKDIPLPSIQSRLKEFKCEIPALNYIESLNYNFDLSYYDKNYFKIEQDFDKPLLMYFILNEILVYTGNQVEKDEIENKIYLGKEKKILIKCENHHDLLRSYPDENEKVLINKCIPNKSELLCPSIPNCLLCMKNECSLCKINYQNLKDKCLKCNNNEILFDNECEVLVDIIPANFPSEFNDDYSTSKTIALKINLESLKQQTNSFSLTNKYESTLFYNIDDINTEDPNNILTLLNLLNFSFINFSFGIFNKLDKNKDVKKDVYGCNLNDNFFLYDDNNFVKGECIDDCDDMRVLNLFCTIPLFFCKEVDNINNRCQKCEHDYTKFEISTNTLTF